MEETLGGILEVLNFKYIFTCNLITWVILTSIPFNFKRWQKRLISSVVAILTGIVMMAIEILDLPDDEEITGMGTFLAGYFIGFFAQFLSWDYIWKYVINFIKTKFYVKDPDKKETKSIKKEENTEE